MNVRASDTDRDATVDLLREAAGEGRLTLEELTDRIEAAVNAVTRSDLVLLTGDLSTGATVGVATQPAGSPWVGGRQALGAVDGAGRELVPHAGLATSSSICARHRSAQRRPTFTPVRCSATSTCSFRKASRSSCKPARGWAEPTCKPSPESRVLRASCSPAERSPAASTSATRGCGKKCGVGGDAPRPEDSAGTRRSPMAPGDHIYVGSWSTLDVTRP